MWLILCLALLVSPLQTGAAKAEAAEQVELFDTDKERVVDTFDNTEAFQTEAQALLNSVSGRVQELNPPLEHAMIVKIPLVPPKQLVHRPSKIDAAIVEIFVVMPKAGSRRPWMILHTKEYETLVVEFGGEVGGLKRLVRLRD